MYCLFIAMKKLIIYQVLPRLFSNRPGLCCINGTIEENKVGKFSYFTDEVLESIRKNGATHIWFTGIVRHATTTDYSAYGIPRQHPSVVKGKAGSPYAITDYYDVDPDLAISPGQRMEEWQQLIQRTHHAGLGVIMDFVPNHLARQYKSVAKPNGIDDFGAHDRKDHHFHPDNNFYYCPNVLLDLHDIDPDSDYIESPAKCTGNDHFDACPKATDWYETVKLNYGVDYTAWGGRQEHFFPIPDTWKKMCHILLFWASKGIDAFRCDMAEMVPAAFWHYATTEVKKKYPSILFIGEVYNPNLYRQYIGSGFDYLYDKVGMYDCLRDVVCGRRSASDITCQWQHTDDIKEHMLYFLENHDEQRIASDFFCSTPQRAFPALIVSLLMGRNPFMYYFGQELGERGMDSEGFSGVDGRTTIFDYWILDSVRKEYFAKEELTEEEHAVLSYYQTVLKIATTEPTVSKGSFFDLMYANPSSDVFHPNSEYTFLRHHENEMLLVASNFSEQPATISVCIPEHAFSLLSIAPRKQIMATDLLTGEQMSCALIPDESISMSLSAHGSRVWKFSL